MDHLTELVQLKDMLDSIGPGRYVRIHPIA